MHIFAEDFYILKLNLNKITQISVKYAQNVPIVFWHFVSVRVIIVFLCSLVSHSSNSGYVLMHKTGFLFHF